MEHSSRKLLLFARLQRNDCKVSSPVHRSSYQLGDLRSCYSSILTEHRHCHVSDDNVRPVFHNLFRTSLSRSSSCPFHLAHLSRHIPRLQASKKKIYFPCRDFRSVVRTYRRFWLHHDSFLRARVSLPDVSEEKHNRCDKILAACDNYLCCHTFAVLLQKHRLLQNSDMPVSQHLQHEQLHAPARLQTSVHIRRRAERENCGV